MNRPRSSQFPTWIKFEALWLSDHSLDRRRRALEADLGPMLALELEERTPDGAKAVVDAAFDRGLLLLSCGLYGNVLRLLPPLTISDEELDEGLGLLDEALATGLAG